MEQELDRPYYQGTPYIVPLVRMVADPRRRIREYMVYRWGIWIEGEMNFLAYLLHHSLADTRFWREPAEGKMRWLQKRQYPEKLISFSIAIPE